MQPGISTHVFFQQRLHPGLLDALASSGAGTIEVFAARHHFDYTDGAQVRELAEWFRSNPVRGVLHQPIYISDRADAQWSRHVAPNLNLIASEKFRRIAAMDEVKRALEAAETVPFTAAVLDLGLRETRWDEAAIENSLSAIEHLKAFAACCSKTRRTRSPRPSTCSTFWRRATSTQSASRSTWAGCIWHRAAPSHRRTRAWRRPCNLPASGLARSISTTTTAPSHRTSR